MRVVSLALLLVVVLTGTALMLLGTGTGVAMLGLGSLGVMFTALSAPTPVELDTA
jgi:hypothetical protein